MKKSNLVRLSFNVSAKTNANLFGHKRGGHSVRAFIEEMDHSVRALFISQNGVIK